MAPLLPGASKPELLTCCLLYTSDRHATTYGPSAEPAYRPGAYDTPSSYAQAQNQRAALSSVPTTAPVLSLIHIFTYINVREPGAYTFRSTPL